MSTFVFLAGFAIGVAVTLLFGVLVDRLPDEDASDVGPRPVAVGATLQTTRPETASSNE